MSRDEHPTDGPGEALVDEPTEPALDADPSPPTEWEASAEPDDEDGDTSSTDTSSDTSSDTSTGTSTDSSTDSSSSDTSDT